MAEAAPVLTHCVSTSEPKTLTSVHVNGTPLNPNDSLFAEAEDEIPTIDYSMLISDDPDQRSEAIEDLGQACLEYGFFTVINHGVPESAIKGALDGCFGFFDLTEEEKREYETKDPTDRIRWGKGYNPGDHAVVKREFLKLVPHPGFHCPTKPDGFSEALQEYCGKIREVMLGLLRGISRNCGLEECYIEKAAKLESGFDICAANVYPPRLESDSPIGLPAHYDPGLLILLIQNVNGGLQLQHNGKWINANILPNSIIVNIGDHLEILSNGKYKSAIHRVVVNNKVRRVSMPIAFGPSLDALVSPAPEFVDAYHPAAYHGLTYKDYLEANKYDAIDGKSSLAHVQLNLNNF